MIINYNNCPCIALSQSFRQTNPLSEEIDNVYNVIYKNEIIEIVFSNKQNKYIKFTDRKFELAMIESDKILERIHIKFMNDLINNK